MKHWNTLNTLSILLLPVTYLFCALVTLRRLLYKIGFFRSWKAPVPVIVVGNISVGGTGKTPVVIALVDYLIQLGYKPGVVSRGYGGHYNKGALLLSAQTTPNEAGDEAVMVYKRTGSPVCVDRNRTRAIYTLLANKVCNVVISDDGLQHYAMRRDMELIVVDEKKLHGNQHCLPSGPLREPVSRLKHADFVLMNRQNPKNDGKSFTLTPTKFISLDTNESREIDAFMHTRVHAVAGTASPERFFNTLNTLGIKITQHVFQDHFAYTPKDFINMKEYPIIMTEKDSVKCHDFGLENAWFLSVSTILPESLCTKLQSTLNKSKKNA